MTKYKVIYHYPSGAEEEEDELFDTEGQAIGAGNYGVSCYYTGGEDLNMSNPGDYPLDGNNSGCDFEVIAVNE